MTSQDKINARRARVKQLIAEGRVMTENMRKQQKAALKYQTQLEERAETILAGLVTHSKPKNCVVDNQPKIKAPKEANTKLAKNMKIDRLASAADEILKELQVA
jgi:hypothetical protein